MLFVNLVSAFQSVIYIVCSYLSVSPSSAKMSYPFSILIISKRFHYNSTIKFKETIKVVFDKIPLVPQKFENMLRFRKYSDKEQLGQNVYVYVAIIMDKQHFHTWEKELVNGILEKK